MDATATRSSRSSSTPRVTTSSGATCCSLLEATGEVEERHDGKFHVRLGEATDTFTRPKGKDIDVQQVVDLRRLFTQAGYDQVVAGLEAKGKED